MNTRKLNLWGRADRIPQIYGGLTALALIVFFFIMYAAGLIHHLELRSLNFFIMLAGVYLAMKQYRRTHAGHLHYFRGMSVGAATSAIASIAFAIFTLLYLKIDPGLMATIIERAPMGRYMNEYIASFAIALEGLFSGLSITYLLLNFVETDKATEPT